MSIPLSTFIGTGTLGKTMSFSIMESASSGDTPILKPDPDYVGTTEFPVGLYYDVIRHKSVTPSSDDPYLVLEDELMTNVVSGADYTKLWIGDFSLDNTALPTAVADSWVSGEMYTILVKGKPGSTASAGYDPTNAASGSAGEPRCAILNFRIETDVAKKLEWIRNDIENVLFPRTKRLLSLAGENLLLDKFTYDTAGNITGLRMRLFDDKTNAGNATIDIADGSLPEPGEMESTYTVDQVNSLPRNTRSSHKSYLGTDFPDATATPNNETAQGHAPGNLEANEDDTWGTSS